MQSSGKEPSELMEELARYSQLLQGHLGLTEEILGNMHQIMIKMVKSSPDTGHNPESHQAENSENPEA